jgi:hypothetical protein
LFANCARRDLSELKASSRSNSSKLGGGSSRKDGGNTCKKLRDREKCQFIRLYCSVEEPGSSVSIVSNYRLYDRAIEVQYPAEAKRIFPLASLSRQALGPTQPPVQWVLGALPPGLKRLGRDTDHSPPSSAEVMSE